MAQRPHLQGLSPLLCQRAQPVPLVTDLLAAIVDVHGIMVVQLTVRSESKDRLSQLTSGRMSMGPNKWITYIFFKALRELAGISAFC